MKNTGLRRGAIALMAAATAVGLAACGSDDESSDATKGDSKLTQSCTIVGGDALAIPTAIGTYKATGDKNKLVLTSGITDAADLIPQANLKELQAKLVATNKQFSETDDDAARTKSMVQQKANVDEFMKICDSALKGSESYPAYEGLTETFPTSIPKPDAPVTEATRPTSPTKEAPKNVPLTAKGTTVKIGQPVVIEYANDGKKAKYELTVTAVDTASDSDLKLLKDDTRKKIGKLVYVRATLKSLDKLTYDNVTSFPDLGGVRPSYQLQTDPQSTASALILIGDFKPCKNGFSADNTEQSFCTPYSLDNKSADVRAVELTGLEGTGDESMYTWTAK